MCDGLRFDLGLGTNHEETAENTRSKIFSIGRTIFLDRPFVLWDKRIMLKRILNVTAEQYTKLETTGVLECGHFAWMAQHEITHVLHPSRCKSIAVTSSYPADDRVRMVAVLA